MILHVVLFRFKSGISWNSELAIDAEKATIKHKENIGHIRAWFCGRNFSLRKQAADFCVIGLFEDVSALDQYMVHDDHMIGVKKWNEISTWEIIDLDLAEAFLDKRWNDALAKMENRNTQEKDS